MTKPARPAEFPPAGHLEIDESVAAALRGRGLPVVSVYGPYFAARPFELVIGRAALDDAERARIHEVLSPESPVTAAIYAVNDLGAVDAAARLLTARVRALPPLPPVPLPAEPQAETDPAVDVADLGDGPGRR